MLDKFFNFNRTGWLQSFILPLCIFATFTLPLQAGESSDFTNRKQIKVTNDIRIIVDISGSMKRTDPQNLRRSAIRLLAGLVPEGSRAGIWIFGQHVNMAVKIGKVNDAWRERARAESKNINSAGLYTNIESVLRKVSFDWSGPDPHFKRNIIILTDGHVDISKNEKLNEASRKRILKEVLPKLEKAQVRIHTIALSDDVDEELLSTLSSYTDGLYKKAHSADDLQKIFLQMLEQSIKLDTLPIKDNKFNVDASINDMTLLVFNKDTTHPTMIVTPDNKKWGKSAHPNNVKWYRDEGYDLITIKKPQKGEWKILALLDPNNRVVVATNLKLRLNDIPSYLVLGDTLNVAAYLEEDGKPLVKQKLLSKFNFIMERDTDNPTERFYALIKSKKSEFSYQLDLVTEFKEGNNEIIIRAKSATVEREVRHQFTVYTSPAEIKISEQQGKYQIEVIPHTNMMRPDTVEIYIVLNDQSIRKLTHKDNSWVTNVEDKYFGSVFTINISAKGANGKPIKMSFEKVLSIDGGYKKLDLATKFKKQTLSHDSKKSKILKTNPPAESENTEKEKQKEKEEEKEEDKGLEKEDAEVEVEEETNWTAVIASVLIGNLLLGVFFGGGYIFIKRRKAKMAENVNGELDDIETKDEAATKNSKKTPEEKIKNE